MVYYKFTASTPFCGTEQTYLLDFDTPLTDNEIRQICDDYAYEVGETYEYLATGWDDDWDSEEEADLYYEDCTCECVELTFEEWQEEIENQN